MSHKFENLGQFAHILLTCDLIRVKLILQHHYIFIIPIYIDTPQVNWYPVTGFEYKSILNLHCGVEVGLTIPRIKSL